MRAELEVSLFAPAQAPFSLGRKKGKINFDPQHLISLLPNIGSAPSEGVCCLAAILTKPNKGKTNKQMNTPIDDHQLIEKKPSLISEQNVFGLHGMNLSGPSHVGIAFSPQSLGGE